MIMRFHKLIQSKLLWLLFLGILITTFVGWGVASNAGNSQNLARLEEPVAKVDGKNISFLRFDTTRRLLMNQSQQEIPAAQLEDLTLTHLAMVDYAGKIGIEVTEDFARQRFALMFADETGTIDQAALGNFRENMRGNHLTEKDYIRFIQEDLIIQNLQRMLASYVLVPGFDVDRWAGSQTDSYTVQYAVLTPEILSEEVEVSDEQLQSYFAENQARFQLPEERIARFVVVKTDAYLDQIEAVTDEAALAYFQSRPELYVKSVKVPATEEGGEESTVQQPIPFEEVKAEIVETLRFERAAKLAEDTAMGFAVQMTPRRGRPGKSLQAVADAASLQVQTTEAFSQWAPLTSLADSAAFKQAVFKLEMTEYGKIGGPVTAGDDYVVMELAEIIPPRLPELTEVEDRVRAAAKSVLTREALQVKAAEVVAAIRSEMTPESDFAAVVAKYELNAVSPPPFELRNLNPNRPMLPTELIKEIGSAKAGDVVGPVDTQFGALFVGYLAARSPNPEAAAELSPEVRNMLSSQLHFPELFNRFREMKIEPLIEKIKPEIAEGEAEVEEGA